MDTVDLQTTITQLQDKIDNFPPLEGRAAKLNQELEFIKNDMMVVNVSVRYGEVYFSLVDKGKKLLEQFSMRSDEKELLGKIKYYMGYLHAAYADFTGKSKEITKYYRIFLVTAMLFIMLSPMMLTPFFTLLFLIPIFAGMRGVKRRSKQGFNLTMLVAPAALMTGALWARNAVYVFGNADIAVSNMMAESGVNSIALAQSLTFIPPILGSLLFVLGIVMSLTGYRLRKYFV